MLALQPGQVVPVARLIEGVWGDPPPDTATTALQGHVSQLRRALGEEAIVTRAPGYLLDVEPESVDVARAERALAAGEPAAISLALEEYRGDPLADVVDAPFAQEALPRLEELRTALAEERFEAELAAGRHAASVAGLRELVARDPLRERPRALLMTALHGSGRTPEALDVYADARRVLAEELGLDPGDRLRHLHEQILRQDPVRPVPTPRAPRAPRARRRPRLPLVLAGVALMSAGAVVLTSGEGEPPAPVTSGVLRIEGLDVKEAVRLPGAPSALAASGGRAWVIDADAQTITRVGGRTFATGDTPLDLASSGGELWVAGGEPGSTQFRGPQVRSVARVDVTGTVRATVSLPARGARPVAIATDSRIARTPEAVWTIGRDGAVLRIDAATERVQRTIDLQAHAIAADGEHLWVLTGDGTVLPLDADGEQGAPASVDLVAPGALAVHAGTAWVTDAASGAVWAVEDGQAEQLPRATAPGAIAYAAGALWLAQPDRRELQRYDLSDRRVTGTVRLRGRPRDLAADGDALWATVGEAGGVAAACGPREGGDGPLVVVDLPLRAGDRSAAGAIADAVAGTFRRRGFRAGGRRVGLRLCDHSTARVGNADPERCRSNAEAYAADRRVVAMIGPVQSSCAHQQLEPAAQARGGPLPIVSPTTTDPLLTRDVRPARRGAYVRLAPRDDRLLAAAARALSARGHRRVFVLADGPRGSYGVVSAAYFEAGMRQSGLRRAGYAMWRGRSPGAVAARVRRAQPDLVFVSGLLDTGAAGVIRAVRRALPGVTIAGGEGLLPVSSLFRTAGPAARGVLIATPFDEPPAKLAELAADLVLDAIARSDGSRAGVAAALRTAPGIDADGDRRAAKGALVRALRGGGSAVNGSTEGAARISRLGPG